MRTQPMKKNRRATSRLSEERRRYRAACRLAQGGSRAEARRLYERLQAGASGGRLKALIHNDLAVLAAVDGDVETARAGFEAALEMDAACEPARRNLAVLAPTARSSVSDEPIRVAILSFLFNWPSTGGGIVHTVELAQFLIRAGYQVQHVYARYDHWGIGKVEHRLPFPSRELVFDESQWNVATIQKRYREAVEAVDPDCVVITDSWNFKARLAEAVRGFPYILRFQALECLCPLNNVRLLPAAGGGLRQCDRNQLADAQQCRQCLAELAGRSGGLHQVERALSGVGTEAYDRVLREAYRDADAVFVVNPPTADTVAPYARRVVVSPAGMAPERFPWPWKEEPTELRTPGRLMVFFAGLVQETIKGFHVLHEACRRLWQRRQDFELVATGDPPGRVDDFTRFVGWQSQRDLPRHLRAADVCVVPAVAQEALGRTAVEAMAAGRPVVASRLGGLPWTIEDGVTGLLCEGGDPEDLLRKIETLLTDPELRRRMGEAGRKRFDEQFRWDVIINRDYRPVLKRRLRKSGRA